MIKRVSLAFIVVITLLLADCCVYAFKIETDWTQYPSTHFIIYYHPDVPNRFVREFTRKSEGAFRSISGRLGFGHSDFWVNQEKIKVFIFKDKQDLPLFLFWQRRDFIQTYYLEKDFFKTTLYNELGRIILKSFIGDKTRVPLWFEEGVACANEKESYTRYLLYMKGLFRTGGYIPLPQFEQENRERIKSPKLFYPMAGSLIIFLLEEYGRKDFADLCRRLREGESFYAAMDKTYRIKDAEGLDAEFVGFLEK